MYGRGTIVFRIPQRKYVSGSTTTAPDCGSWFHGRPRRSHRCGPRRPGIQFSARSSARSFAVRSTRASRRRRTASSSRRPIRFGRMPTLRPKSESLPRAIFSAWVARSSKSSTLGNDPRISVSRRRGCSCGRDLFAAPAPARRGRSVPTRRNRRNYERSSCRLNVESASCRGRPSELRADS
jgi:hypothetical protein